ncbi:serine hydrolase domain-containing protein [Thermodesulfobacteriota bacterium]
MKTLGKISVGVTVSIFGLVSLVLLWAFLSYPTEYVMRGIRWGDADVYDYQKFPARSLAVSPSPFKFDEKLNEAMVQSVFEQNSTIDNLDDFLSKNRTQAFIVIQDDAILYEKYFNNASRDTIVTSFSVAKSFTSALIGTAIADGFIQSVDDPITAYLPELAERDPAFANITICDLLRMSSGIKYRENSFFNGDDTKTYYFPDLRQLALKETSVVDPPGSHFLYNNYHPLLLGMILERATGMSVTAYLEAKIWKPIGMEFNGSWSLDSESSGFEKMESGLNGRAIDFAKFGRLYLNNGYWEGTHVVPAKWVGESTRADASIDSGAYYPDEFIFKSGRGYYGYLWWGLRRGQTNYDFIALGNHGQFIYISPQKSLIILRNGESYGEFGGAKGWLDMFYQFASGIRPSGDGYDHNS